MVPFLRLWTLFKFWHQVQVENIGLSSTSDAGTGKKDHGYNNMGPYADSDSFASDDEEEDRKTNKIPVYHTQQERGSCLLYTSDAADE